MNREIKAVGIIGMGSALPSKVLTNTDLESMVDTSDEWIMKRTGISERRILDDGVPASKLGIMAAENALKDAGIAAEDLDLIITATETPDYLTPSTACTIQGGIGASKAAAFDINAACTGFIYAMTVAKQFIQNGMFRYILVVGCEGLSRIVDWKDRNTCVLFGDGAGAAVIGPVEEGYGIMGSYLGADGASGKKITIPCCSFSEEDIAARPAGNRLSLWMDGTEVFKFAVKFMEHATRKVVDDCGLTLNDINYIFPHQANTRIIEGALKRLEMPEEKLYRIIQKYGNISSASIPVAMDEAYRKGLFKKGDNVVVVGFGGGLTWGSALVKWSK